MQTAYSGVHLWAQAVIASQSTEVASVLSTLEIQTFDAPEGIIAIDPDTHHAWRSMRIAQVNAKQGFDVVWASEHPIHPEPYPFHILPSDARRMLQALYNHWNHAWAAPAALQTP